MQLTQELEPPTSATQQVWAVSELVGTILSYLEPRDIIVYKRIDRFTRDVINKNTNTDVGRKIWTLPTGTHRKVWLIAQDYRDSFGSIRQISETGEQARKACMGGEALSEPVVANPLLVETTVEREMVVLREKYIKRAQWRHPHKGDVTVLAKWLWIVRPNRVDGPLAAAAVAAKPRSISTLQDPLWLQGKSSTANMQLFDPPIYGTVKATSMSWDGTIRMEAVPTHGSDTSITWGAVGKAYKRVVDRYTKAQFKKHGIVYNHAETNTPIGMEIRLPQSHTLVPQDLYWWFRDLLDLHYRFDSESFVDRMHVDSTNDTFEIANAGYNVPLGIPLAFKKYMEQAKAEDRKVLGKPN